MLFLNLMNLNICLYAGTAQEYIVRNEKISLIDAKKYPTGEVQSGILAGDWSQKVTKAEIFFKSGTMIEFFKNGQVKSGSLGKQASLVYNRKRLNCPYGTEIVYNEEGTLESPPVYPERVDPDQPLKPTADQEFYLACQTGDLVKVKELTRNGKNSGLLTNALVATVSSSAANRFDVVKYLVNSGAKVNYPSEVGTPLVFSIIEQHKNVPAVTAAKTKPKQKLLVPEDDPEVQRKAALASNKIAINMLTFLISKKLDLSVKNGNGVTPVHYAIDADAGLDMFKILIKNKADYKSKSNFGQTPLERNKELDRQNIYKYLSGLK